MRHKSIFTVIFLNFIGYYVYLLLLFNLGLSTSSFGLSIGLRIVILLSLLIFFFNSEKIKAGIPIWVFLSFSVVYLTRIIIDALKGLEYYVSTPKLILYYLSFGMIPFLLISNIKFRPGDLITIRKALLLSGFIFSILSLFFFKDYIGTVGRLTTDTAGEDMMSPLALSYCSSLAIGISGSYWMENKTTFRERIFLLLTIIFSAIPFFLGSSRGSLVALILPFIFIFFSKKKMINNLRLIFIGFIALLTIIYFSEYFGSSLIDRFTQTSSDIKEGNDAAIRSVMWENAFNQFSNHPLMGDKLKLDGFNIHPHNVIFEILQVTGFLGIIPFLILIGIVFKKALKIFKYAPQYSWLGILFMQSFIQNMFSGSIYGASWLLMSAALIISINNMLFRRTAPEYHRLNIS